MRKIIIYIITLAACSGLRVGAAWAEDTRNFWTVEELVEMWEQEKQERDERCSGDFACENDLAEQKMQENEKYRAMVTMVRLRLNLTYIDPAQQRIAYYYIEDNDVISLLGTDELLKYDIYFDDDVITIEASGREFRLRYNAAYNNCVGDSGYKKGMLCETTYSGDGAINVRLSDKSGVEFAANNFEMVEMNEEIEEMVEGVGETDEIVGEAVYEVVEEQNVVENGKKLIKGEEVSVKSGQVDAKNLKENQENDINASDENLVYDNNLLDNDAIKTSSGAVERAENGGDFMTNAVLPNKVYYFPFWFLVLITGMNLVIWWFWGPKKQKSRHFWKIFQKSA